MQNFKYQLNNQVIKQKLCKNKKCTKCDELKIFENHDTANLNIWFNFSNTKCAYSGKTEKVHFLFKGICAKIYAKFLI